MDFYSKLQDATAVERQRLLSTPIIASALAGKVTLQQYLCFLKRAFHHVKHTPSLLMACGSRLSIDREWVRAALAHYIGEEIGHHEWILSDIAAAGGDAAAVKASTPDFDTELMVAYAYDTITRNNPLGFLGMVYVLEGTSIALASRLADVLGRTLNLPATAFSYLTSHGDLDVSHIDHFANLVNRLDASSDQACIEKCAKDFFRLYGNVLNNIDEEAYA
jgi:pyrroloquinoline quinone (PQQ) biosynthesis protein C